VEGRRKISSLGPNKNEKECCKIKDITLRRDFRFLARVLREGVNAGDKARRLSGDGRKAIYTEPLKKFKKEGKVKKIQERTRQFVRRTIIMKKKFRLHRNACIEPN